ncbi:Ankyrin repeat protein [Giardia duodenalis]|uniref:Ankyrin repeat protein n=1 Tax=Giardia intestinalis TaxID=5741 RepID=V6TPI0_GIAIN|nr:Ankyrin repeat protein [Giardia intestinalis]
MEKEKGLQDRSGWTALMHAVHNNHPGVVEILATHECGNRDISNRTALMIAAERGYAEIVAALAPHEKGLTDSSGNTALMLAANNAHIEAVRVLVEHEKGARDTRNRTALMTAAQRGDLEMVKVLAEHEKGITDEDGRTALVHAARAGHREAAELLMEHEKDVTGWTMLMCVAALGDVDMVSQHIDERSQKDKRGQTALIIAAQNRRDEAVKLLVKHEGGVSGWTSLICAAYLGNVDLVKDNLHEKGCNDITGMTALMWAAQQGHREPVEVLIEHEKGLKDNKGNTAFMHALKNKHEDVAVILSKQEAPSWTSLMCAAFTGNTEIAGKHLSERNRKNSDGDTALMIAARVGHGTVVELLDPIDEHDVTALMRAAARGDTEMVELLIPIQKGAKDKDGNTAFTHALNNSHVDAALLLREYEAPSWTLPMHAALIGDIETVRSHLRRRSCCKNNIDRNAVLIIAAKAGHKDIVELLDHTDERGVTALMRAAERGDVEAVRVLIPLQKGRKTRYFYDNRTALMMAAAYGYTEAVGLLVEHEGGVQNEHGKTALMHAAENGHTDCIKLLVEKEAGMRDNYGWTALMVAAESNNLEHVKLLLEKEGGMQNNEGYTALMIAIKSNNVDCARLLAKKEGHIKRTYKQNNIGYSSPQTCTETVLDIAKANGCKAIIAILYGGV